MPRYIDAVKLENDGWSASRTYQQDTHTMVYETNKMTDFPTEDVRENVHAHWEIVYDKDFDDGGKYICGNCRHAFSFGAYFELCRFDYCPNCGAKMDEW